MSEATRAPAPNETDRITELETKLREAESSLAQSREALDAAERRRTIDRELAREGAVDVETTALLTETLVANLPRADLRAAVADLKRSKPFLFRAGAAAVPGSPAMAAEPGPAPSTIAEAAQIARETGDRRVLLRYLRLKRGQ